MNPNLRKGALVAAVVAFAILPTFLKSYGVYLCTLFCIYLMATYGLNLTVGYAGQMSLGQAAFFGIGAYIAAIALQAGLPFLVVLPIAAVACFAVGLALGFPALRDNPIRAESLGVNITAYTLLAFAIGAACAGIGGVFFAALVQFIEPAPFHFSVSLMMLLAVIVGGSGRFFGPVIGTVVIVLLPEWLRFMQNWYLAVFGFAVVALMMWLPGGILSLTDRFQAKGAAK
jgi:branched-chain amino acid transport system permease protein